MVISITDNARRQIHKMMEDEEENVMLRFGVKGGGCSGLSYSIGFDYDINEDLDLLEEINGVSVIISKPDIPIIENTEIDFKQNMMGGGFVINNPNAIFSCGCGSSFRTEQHVGAPGDC